MSLRDDLLRRAEQYSQRHGLVPGDELGSGIHGIVWITQEQRQEGSAEARSAIKVHSHESDYLRERDVYLRLKEHNVATIRGCHVPRLLRYDDELWVVEMTVVKRPFVLDFAGAYLDRAPDFPEEVLADWHAEKQEQFGRRFADVQAILRCLQGYGVYLVDVNPGNVSFGDQGGSN